MSSMEIWYLQVIASSGGGTGTVSRAPDSSRLIRANLSAIAAPLQISALWTCVRGAFCHIGFSKANNAGARKAIRKIAARTEVNKARRTRVRTFLRKFQEAVTGGDAGAAKAAFVEAQSELMRAVSKGVVHKNTGSRKVSRLAAQLKKLSTAA